MKPIIFGVVALFLLNVTTSSLAGDLTVEQYQKTRDDPRIKSYLSGVGQGIHFANIELKREGKPRLYCPPDELLLNVGNIYQMIDATLESNPTLPKTTFVTAIVLLKLQQTFPCK